jgi:hypothetical protein
MAAYNGATWIGETLDSLLAQTLRRLGTGRRRRLLDGRYACVLRAFTDPRITGAPRGRRMAARSSPATAASPRRAGATSPGSTRTISASPGASLRQVAYLDAHPDVSLVSCATDFLVEGRRLPGNWPRPLAPVLIDWLMLVQNPIAWSSVMFRAEAARRLDPFERPEMRYVEDFDLYQRMRPFGRLAQVDEVLMLYRCHAGGASQMFNCTMRAHAELLLRERHEALLSESAPDIAALLVRHVMAREPVPDAETLNRLFAGVGVLRTAFGEDNPGEELAAVDREISQLWWRVCRASVRAGSLLIHNTLGSQSLPLGQAADLVASQMIGGMRAMKRGLTGR